MQEYNDFDTRTTMGELKYLIDVINERWEQIVFNMQNRIKAERLPRKTALEYQRAAPLPIQWAAIFALLLSTFGIGLIVYFLVLKYGVRSLYYDKNSSELDYLINKEWSPRMKAVRENVHLFSSDRELRDAYNEFDGIDKEISKMTVRGRIKEKDKMNTKKMGVFAGILALGTVSVAAVGIHSAGKSSFKYD